MLSGSAMATGIHLDWDEPLDDGGSPIDEYRIERTEIVTSQTDSFITANMPRSFDDVGLNPDTEYSYKVFARNNNGESLTSEEITIRTLPSIQRTPSAVNNLQISAVTGSEITFRWDTPTDSGTSPIDSYKINKKTSSMIDWNFLSNISNNQFKDTGLNRGTNYSYQVIAVNQDGLESDPEIISQRTNECLIATATFGSDLSPQVQQLREIRDLVVLETDSGSSFMGVFNQIYYSFSPTVAQWERENEIFKETIKISITPLLSSLSILNYVSIDSEVEMISYGLSIILLNIGMYFVIPITIVWKVKQKIKN